MSVVLILVCLVIYAENKPTDGLTFKSVTPIQLLSYEINDFYRELNYHTYPHYVILFSFQMPNTMNVILLYDKDSTEEQKELMNNALHTAQEALSYLARKQNYDWLIIKETEKEFGDTSNKK